MTREPFCSIWNTRHRHISFVNDYISFLCAVKVCFFPDSSIEGSVTREGTHICIQSPKALCSLRMNFFSLTNLGVCSTETLLIHFKSTFLIGP